MRKQYHYCYGCEHKQVFTEIPDTSDGKRGSIWDCNACGFEDRMRAPRKITSRDLALQIGNDPAAMAMAIIDLKAVLDDAELINLARFLEV